MSTKLQIVGGGGGGGRVAVHANQSYSYRGQFLTYGGKGRKESGGSGTTFVQSTTAAGQLETTLSIDNSGNRPINTAITDVTKDSGKTYVTMGDTTASEVHFDHVNINGAGHLVLRNTTGGGAVPVRVGELHGDYSGMLHTSEDISIHVEDSDSPFPSSFVVYDNANITLPQGNLEIL